MTDLTNWWSLSNFPFDQKKLDLVSHWPKTNFFGIVLCGKFWTFDDLISRFLTLKVFFCEFCKRSLVLRVPPFLPAPSLSLAFSCWLSSPTLCPLSPQLALHLGTRLGVWFRLVVCDCFRPQIPSSRHAVVFPRAPPSLFPQPLLLGLFLFLYVSPIRLLWVLVSVCI